MSVHEALRTLVTRHGDRVLQGADDLRATLDDFLEEGQTTPGEINLLVDAVRLGAYSQMISTLTHGAEPRAAVEAAGARLAEDRGGDQRSASWACAALAYAVGKVPEALVLSYTSQHPPRTSGVVTPPPAAPAFPYGIDPARTVAPGLGPQQPSGPPSMYGPSGVPAATQGPSYAPQSQGAGSWQPPPPPSGSRKNLFIGLGVAVAAAAIVGVVAVVATGGDDDPPQNEATTEPVEPSDSETTPEEEFDPAFGVAELGSTYSALGADVAAGADSCERQQPEEEGQTELVECTFSQLDVVFTTYADSAALDEARSRLADDTASESYEVESSSTSDSGQFHMVSDSAQDVTWMYWDSASALQSAYVTDTTNELPRQAATAFFDQRRVADATRTFPDPVAPFESPQLYEMAQDYIDDQVRGRKVAGCQKSELFEGDVEAVSCLDGDFSVEFYLKVDLDALEAERAAVAEDAVSDEPWNWFAGRESDYPTSGQLIKWRNEDNDAVVYWDDVGLLTTGYINSNSPGEKFPEPTAYWMSGDSGG